MGWLIWSGAAVSLAGVAMLAWCIRLGLAARAPGLDEGARRARLQKVVALNVAALGVSGLGLAAVVAGILLG
ncbi:MAG: hypothetical protein H5U20_05210 [Rhodobacteraceae bacterium]|nr:hypothetical protein [Paracoccaceae bacterium]